MQNFAVKYFHFTPSDTVKYFHFTENFLNSNDYQ